MDAGVISVRSAVILKADRLYAELLRQQMLGAFPGVRVTLASSVEATRLKLATDPIDLLVTSVGATLEGDVFDLLMRGPARSWGAGRVLVVTDCREYRSLAALRSLAINGVFDSASEPPEQFITALRIVAAGARYWSTSVVEYLRRIESQPDALYRLLTAFEQIVLSVIGDGCDNNVAADELGVSPATVATVRRELHRKLRVQHRGELVRAAAQYGFVRFIPGGVVRPGFAMLSAAYHPRRPRRPAARVCEVALA